MRKRARVDANHGALRKLARSLGASWLDMHQLGGGAPDACLGVAGQNLLVEIKDGDKPPSERTLTRDEHEWHSLWRGQVDVVESEADLERLIAAARMTR